MDQRSELYAKQIRDSLEERHVRASQQSGASASGTEGINPEHLPLISASDAIRIGAVFQDARKLFVRKNAEYGNSIEDTGVLGSAVALTGDVGRLRVMVIQSTDNGRTARYNVRDKLQDIIVQAAIGIMMLDEDNWNGK